MRLLLFFIFSFQIVSGQDSSFVTLQTVTVSANIIGTALKSTGRNITIIDQKTIALLPVKTLDGVLQYALNVDVRSRSSAGVQADISIRGGHYDQTLILIDGVKMNDPQTGHHSLNIPISLAQIDKIEVLQGGASRVFGPSAFSGVINIITKKITKNQLNGVVLGGKYGLFSSSINTRIIRGNSFFSISGDFLRSDSYSRNTAFNKYSISTIIGKNLKNGYIDLRIAKMENKFGAANFYSPKFFNQFEQVAAFTMGSSWTHLFSDKLISTLLVNYRKHNDVYDFDNYRKDITKLASVNYHETNVYDIEWKFKLKNRFGNSAFGVESRTESVISNRLGDALNIYRDIKNESDVKYTKYKARNNFSGYLEHNKTWEKLTLSVGSLLNYNSQFGLAFYPGADVSFGINNTSTIYSSVNRSLRFPTFTELYLNTATVTGDPNLKPEKALSFEIGFKKQTEVYNAIYSVFYKKTQDAIDKIQRLNAPKPTMENINDINMFGFESSHIVALNDIFKSKFFGNLSFNYAYLLADRKEDGFQSFYTLNYLKHKFNVGLNLLPFKNFNINLNYTIKARQGSYFNDKLVPAQNMQYKVINLVDLRAVYGLKKTKYFVDINNLLNQKNYEFGFIEQPGRWISGGLMFDL
jgi:vitamin B12 transporter